MTASETLPRALVYRGYVDEPEAGSPLALLYMSAAKTCRNIYTVEVVCRSIRVHRGICARRGEMMYGVVLCTVCLHE